MTTVGIIILVIGLICLFFGIFVGALKFLLYVGIALILFVVGALAVLAMLVAERMFSAPPASPQEEAAQS